MRAPETRAGVALPKTERGPGGASRAGSSRAGSSRAGSSRAGATLTGTPDVGPESGRVEVTLATVPGLGGLYARGVAGSARIAVATRLGRAVDALPDVVYVAHGVRADPGHLTAYQHLLGESASDVLPAGFVHVLAFPVATALMVRGDFPLPLAGMVHLENRVEQFGPISLGEELDVRAYARDLRAHRAGTQVELVTEVRVPGGSRGGELAWRGTSTYLAKGTHLRPDELGDGQTVGEDQSSPAGDAGSEGGRTAGRRGSDPWTPPVPTAQWRLAGDVGRRYATVSGDRNPIHLSALTAKALGFPRAIAHGMYTASRALAGVGPARTEAFTWTVEFASPVLLPGTVTVRIAAADKGAPGYSYAAWNAGSSKLHLTGKVTPL
ncbi:MaoC/PaaZ C-terminal domain-containing protein [Pengzhenrongella phosphoraccumulans]|uniref:MaoC/PaaZ C-terminal domain-containing protein n=1 Tax=Pengzhenrongella phosphoraccumulans TaxID=3114394 RepID=UPI00388D92AA